MRKNIKSILIIVLIAFTAILFFFCIKHSSNSVKNVKTGHYVAGLIYKPNIYLREDKSFTFSPNGHIDSIVLKGNYALDNNKLTLTATNGDIFIFDVGVDTLIYQKSKYSKMDLKDKTIFKLNQNEEIN